MKMKYYDILPILSKNAIYNIIFGERSNGKTFAVLDLILDRYISKHEQGAYIRRYKEDFVGARGKSLFNNFINNPTKGNIIYKKTKGEFNSVYYQSSMWYLCFVGEDGTREKMDLTPFCYAFSLASQEHDKSTSYPNITTILFDEFLTRGHILVDEFIIFTNTLSTIIRDRDNVQIFMCGNTVNQYSPYFEEMGLKHIRKMKKGDIDIYTYGDSDLVVAVEYSDSPSKKGKKSDKYFAFDNPKLKMITQGEWELALYPHFPLEIKEKIKKLEKNYTDFINYTYFIIFDRDILQCEIIYFNTDVFTYIHRKTTPIQKDNTGLIYQTEFSPKWNYRRRITVPTTPLEQKILSFYRTDKVFYQDNNIGEIVRNYIEWCSNPSFN